MTPVVLPVLEGMRELVWNLALDLVRWLWRAEDASHPRSFTTYCAWCGLVYVVEAPEPPADYTAPPGWHSAHGVGVWCSLRCWVEHWRADHRIPPPPVTEAGGGEVDNPGD